MGHKNKNVTKSRSKAPKLESTSALKRRKNSKSDRIVRDKSSQLPSSAKSEGVIEIPENQSSVLARASSVSINYSNIDKCSEKSGNGRVGRIKTRLLSNLSRQAQSELAEKTSILTMPMITRR